MLLQLLVGFGVFAFGLYIKNLFISFKTRKFKYEHGFDSTNVIAFFHPYCDVGGGGERVLWSAVQSIQQTFGGIHIVIYAWDKAGDKATILKQVEDHFRIRIDPSTLTFIYLKSWKYLEASSYKRLTLIGQSLGSILTGWEAISTFMPDYFVDTLGHSFTYPLARLFGCKVVAYVHYPTISTDMLQKVSDGTFDYNNQKQYSKSHWKVAKLIYYRIFSILYSICGSFSQVTMVNSSWTRNHILNLWKKPKSTFLVYPPCDTDKLKTLDFSPRENWIVSVAQFRPEKAHSLQLEAFADFLEKHPEFKSGKKAAKLFLVGSCRNAQDKERVSSLKNQAKTLNLGSRVEFLVDLSFKDLVELLARASVGIHTMKDEHFGISIIEFMVSGVIPLANDSAGPKMDIVTQFEGKTTGFLASTTLEYSEKLYEILKMSPVERLEIQRAARASVLSRFSSDEFSKKFIEAFERVIPAGPSKIKQT